jgi:serine/threonine protein kinase
MMSNLFWMGLRDLFEQFLPILMRMVLMQVQNPALQLSVSPFDMGFYVRENKHGNTTLADTVMLGKVCRSCAESAIRKGAALKEAHPQQQRGPSCQGLPAVVVFYAPDLFQQSPALNLVVDAILRFSVSDDFIVYGCGYGNVDEKYPPAKDLSEYLNTRKVLLGWKQSMSEVLAEFRNLKPDVVVTFAGWAEGDLAEVLWVLAQDGVTILSTLGPNLMHFPEAISYTLVGSAVADWQVSSPTRERLAIYATPDTYQPAQLHSHLKVDGKPLSRADFGLPSNFIVFNPATSNRLGEASIHLYCELICRPGFETAFVLLLDRPETNRFLVWKDIAVYVETSGCCSNIRDRFLFRQFSSDIQHFYALMYAVADEGEGGASIGTFGSVEPHTSTHDSLLATLPVFVTEDPKGLMGARVAAEVVKAAGLGALCVGDTNTETLDKLTRYKRSKELQARAREHLKKIRQQELGLLNPLRIPRAWETVIKHCLAVRDAHGDRAGLQDFQIPSDPSPAPAFVVDRIAASVDAIIWQLHETETEMEGVTRDCLLELASEHGIDLQHIEGSGSFVNTICCRRKDGQRCALKMDKRSRHHTRIHNSPVVREGAILLRADTKLRNHPFRGMLPRPLFFLQNGTSFMFTTRADDRGRVICCLLCEFIDDDFKDVLNLHKANWQERGFFAESFRLDFLCPMFLSMYYLHDNAFFNLDIKPGNFRRRKDGQVVYIDFGLGHCYLPAPVGSAKQTTQQETCLFNRKLTSVIEQERAAAVGRKPCLQRGLLQCPKRKQGAKLMPISRSEIQAFDTRASIHGLTNLGHGTKGFKDPDLVPDSPTLSTAKRWQSFSKRWASATDIYAAQRTVLYVLTKKREEALNDWDKRAIKAAKSGAHGFRKMLLDSLKPNVEMQQPMAFERIVDLLTSGLKPDSRLDMAKTVTHSMNTLPILPPEYEQALSRGEGLPLPGGNVQNLFNCPVEKFWGQELPRLEFCIQPDGAEGNMGIGVRALQDINVGDVIGAYVGDKVSDIGRKYVSKVYPSRFQVSIRGKIPLLSRECVTKLACDAQLNATRDFEWALRNNVTGPFLNAADDANCRLDRCSAWIDPDSGLLCMLMFCMKEIRQGDFLMWKYDPRAGVGSQLSFD